jgi:hypothetical protein
MVSLHSVFQSHTVPWKPSLLSPYKSVVKTTLPSHSVLYKLWSLSNVVKHVRIRKKLRTKKWSRSKAELRKRPANSMALHGIKKRVSSWFVNSCSHGASSRENATSHYKTPTHHSSCTGVALLTQKDDQHFALQWLTSGAYVEEVQLKTEPRHTASSGLTLPHVTQHDVPHVTVRVGNDLQLSDMQKIQCYEFTYEYWAQFLARSLNCEKRLLVSSCLSAWNNSAPTGRTFMTYIRECFFKNLSRKFKFH